MPYIVAIGGGSGSGKSTLAEALHQRIHDSAILSYDAYYRDQSALPPSERAKLNFDDPKILDEGLFIQDLDALRKGRSIEVPIYDFKTHTRAQGTVRFDPASFIIVEGIMVYAISSPRDHYDFLVYVEAESDIRLSRRILRDVRDRGRTAESVISQYLATVRPAHKLYVEPWRTQADFVFENSSQTGLNEKELSRLAEAIEKAAKAQEKKRQ